LRGFNKVPSFYFKKERTMKKILLSIFILAMLVLPVQAEDHLVTLLDGVVATGTGSKFRVSDYYESGIASDFTCMLTAAGTAATSFTMILEGSLNNVNFYGLASNVYTVATADTAMFHVINKGVKFIRGNFSSKVGGDGTSAITMRCIMWR
jgi:hypothetical protein